MTKIVLHQTAFRKCEIVTVKIERNGMERKIQEARFTTKQTTKEIRNCKSYVEFISCVYYVHKKHL